MTQQYTNGFASTSNEENISCEEVTIPVPWGHISGKWWGSRCNQPILAIHGWQDNAGTFDNLAPLLANHIPILCIDLPGHGLSSHYPHGQYYYIFWDGIVVIRRIVQYFKWTKVKLMGHSLGGAISFLYAASYPDEVDSYICIDVVSPAIRNPTNMVSSISEHVDKFLKYENMKEKHIPAYDKKEMLDLVFDAYKGSVTKENCEILMKRGMRLSNQNEIYCFTRDIRLKVPVLGFMTIEQVLEFAAKTTCKVMNIRAKPGMKWEHPEYYDRVLDELAKTANCLDRHVIPGTHHLHLNTPERLADIIIKFSQN